MMNAANATLLVASAVIHLFQNASGVFWPLVLIVPSGPGGVRVGSSPLWGESVALRPISEEPLRITVRVVAWWMCALSCKVSVLYIFSNSSNKSIVWKVQSLAVGLNSESLNTSQRM